MNISSATGSSTASYSAASSAASSLEKQVSSLQAELKKVNDSKDDQATKDKKAQVIQQQIQQLQQEIAKQKAEASTNKASGLEVNENANVSAPKAVTGPVANSDRTFDVRI
ncbi:FlxA-like family protein [Paenibacillus luteus]|uniref:FlxA-like family protein n=1 Tax=Paenibacillus luteus TaxID=2545753 RepID=UPI00114476EC|nr:FlxA-like family protein [Paenibacillus luteus]